MFFSCIVAIIVYLLYVWIVYSFGTLNHPFDLSIKIILIFFITLLLLLPFFDQKLGKLLGEYLSYSFNQETIEFIISWASFLTLFAVFFVSYSLLISWILKQALKKEALFYFVLILVIIFTTFLFLKTDFWIDLLKTKALHLTGGSWIGIIIDVIASGFKSGLVSGGIFLLLMLFVILLSSLSNALINRIKVSQQPYSEIIQTLCYLIPPIEKYPERWNNLMYRKNIIFYLEWIAQKIEFQLFQNLRVKDIQADQQLQEKTQKLVAYLRQLKDDVLLPKADSRSKLLRALAQVLECASEGRLFQDIDSYPVIPSSSTEFS